MTMSTEHRQSFYSPIPSPAGKREEIHSFDSKREKNKNNIEMEMISQERETNKEEQMCPLTVKFENESLLDTYFHS